MKPIWYISVVVLSVFLLLFVLAQVMNIPIDSASMSWVEKGGAIGIVLSISLLIADVFLPIPASLIMIANGALYGVWVGALVSLVGGVGAAVTGYYLGRAGERSVSRWVGDKERAKAQAFFDKWGILAIVISRPVPLLSETIAVMAGLSKWHFGWFVLSTVVGLLPVVAIYAVSGAYASLQDYGVYAFLVVMAAGVLVWLVGRRLVPQGE